MAAVAKEIDERAFRFVCNAILFVRSIRSEPGVRRLIALRSANESVLWLRAFVETRIGNAREASVLLDEARQLSRIIAAIIVRTKQHL